MIKMKKSTQPDALEVITANCLNLYLKAKLFHLNVTGPTFYGDHHTYDGIASVGTEWFDVFAERMRTFDKCVHPSPKWLIDNKLFDDGCDVEDSGEMLEQMLETLEDFSAYINANLDDLDKTTQNMVQEFDAAIGKNIYFVRSSM